jgi:phosphate/sulfate permease
MTLLRRRRETQALHLGQGFVAIALGLGTMIGCKRVVITVGERIGKHYLA